MYKAEQLTDKMSAGANIVYGDYVAFLNDPKIYQEEKFKEKPYSKRENKHDWKGSLSEKPTLMQNYSCND